MNAKSIEHCITAGSLEYRFTERVTPPRKPHLTKHRFTGARHDPGKTPIKLKSHA